MLSNQSLKPKDPFKGTRKSYYLSSECVETLPERPDVKGHTMGPENFKKYIGRVSTTGPVDSDNRDFINCKKFTEKQKDYLRHAYAKNKQVRVIGAEKKDFDLLLSIYQRELVLDLGFQSDLHRRENKGKIFNSMRALMLWTKDHKKSIDDPEEIAEIDRIDIELWVIVFPSSQYVDQIAELIQAIYDDFKECKIGGDANVLVWHFPKLEKEVAKWTELERGISAYLRHGDIVIIGNVELLLPGILEVGYHAKFDYWKRFGLNKMFGIQILVNNANHTRVVLLGITECFWGKASAYYVEALLRSGARHILYGSKAGTMSSKLHIKTLKSPSSFSVFAKHDNNLGLNDLTSIITSNAALRHLANLTSIGIAGINATVPTVIGETHSQRERFNNLNPSTMDDEDGYIATVVEAHNKATRSIAPAGFLPVHYISDYIHKPGELASSDQTNLSETEIEPRDELFKKMGGFFGIYTSIFGLVEHVKFDKFIPKPYLKDLETQELSQKVKLFLANGMIKEAIATLSKYESHSGSHLRAIAQICQKYGLIDDALTVLDILMQRSYWQDISDEKKVENLIIEARSYSQIGDMMTARIKIDEIFRSYKEALESNGQFNSVCRRRALTIAFDNYEISNTASLRANYKKMDLWFERAKINIQNKTDESYEKATNDVYYMIAALSFKDKKELDFESRMRTARCLYLEKSTDEDGWITNLEKSVVITLFIEAAHFLVAHGIDDTKGLMRLCIAHMYNTQIGGSERSEGYGELVSFIPDQAIKDIFRLAMRIDESGKRDFQNTHEAKRFWPNMHNILKILDFPKSERARMINEILTAFDESIDK